MQKKFLSRLLALMALLCVVLGVAVPSYYRGNMEQKYTEMAYNYGCLVAERLGTATVGKYEKTLQKDAAYDEVYAYLERMRETLQVKYLYVVVPRENDYVYIWTSSGEAEKDIGILGFAEAYYQGGEEYMKRAMSSKDRGTVPLLITNNKEYGYVASAYAPLVDTAGNTVALVGVDLSMDKVEEEIDRFLYMFAAFMAAVMLLGGCLFYHEISRVIISPLLALNASLEEYAEQKMRKGESLKIELHTGDEIERLADSVVTVSRELQAYMRDFEKATREKERVATELNVATNIQMHMLPSVFPPFPERKEFDIYATSVPAKEVGGDFYDFFLVDHDHIAVVMADVSGKGVPAALFMVIAKTLIKNRTQVSASLDPAKILYDVNNQLCEGNEAGMFVTVWLAILQISTGKGMVANAGHGSPMVLRAGGQYEHIVRKHSPGVAMMEGTRFKEYEIEMHPGDRFFVCTDGVTEAIDKDEELFGVQRLQAALNENPEADPKESLENVKKHMDAFVGDAEQFDDITMLNFVYYGTK